MVPTELGILDQWLGIVFQMIQETFLILICLKQQYKDGNQLNVLVGCVKTTYMTLVSLLFQINYTRKFTQVL